MFRLLATGAFWMVLLASANGQDNETNDVERYRLACEGGHE